jgi:hypothetical protein
MEDTSEEMRDLQQAYWMTLSEEERYRRCGRMFQMTKRFVEARAPQGLNQEEMKRFVFKEIYGFDMPDRPDRSTGID